MKPLPVPLRVPVRSAFRALAGLRGAPAFHPKGVLYDAELVVDGAGSGEGPLTGPLTGPLPAGTWPALVRLSKGIGTPDAAPDFLGVAVRIESPQGPIDFLCTTVFGTRGLARFVLAPAASWGRASLSSLMVLQRDADRLTVCLECSDPRITTGDPDAVAAALPVEMALSVVGSGGRVTQTGRLTLAGRSSRTEHDVAFDPELHTPAGWQLGPRWLSRVRETAYVGSRRGRDADDGSIPR